MAIQEILTDLVMPISEVKRNPMALAEGAKGAPIAVLNRNKPVLYCFSPEMYEDILDRLEDIELNKIVDLREKGNRVKVSLDDL